MGSAPPEDLPYWQVNVPVDQRTPTCPDFLRSLSAKDQRIVGTPQADFAVLSWPDVREIVANNELDRFQRDPLALRRYLAYGWGLKQQYGSAVDFVLQERLRWTAAELQERAAEKTAAENSSSVPDFSQADDIKVLCNDWPYGIDERIVHLVVWTKFLLAEDPATGDLTDAARAAIAAYVDTTFGGAHMPPEHVVWFKNWQSLKSVLLVEHFHVMLFDPPAELIARITNGDVPLSKRLEEAQ
ncbi:hypothetical protein SCUCBS95973_008625 [Sporothrix curviconia]|uniref:N-acetylglucosamine-induced protein 1 n=1 Tax=Sporothrix curviconia TaxID=1260050 RepID=A0ABP0CN79_9PEZI